MLNKTKLIDVNEIMKQIQPKMPFYNEYQFQFGFALALKDHFFNDKDIEIAFEEYYPTLKTSTATSSYKDIEKRNYTDIVVYDCNGNFIAFELKYNLKDGNRKVNKRWFYNNGKYDVSIAKKGATDNCRYDFLYDVYRLESIKKHKINYENTQIKNFIKGYAIIISNDESIWEKSSPHNYNKTKKLNISKNCDRNFCIGDNSQTVKDCQWYNKNGIICNKQTRPNFKLNKSYVCHWNCNYFNDKKKLNPSPSFRYLIIEI